MNQKIIVVALIIAFIAVAWGQGFGTATVKIYQSKDCSGNPNRVTQFSLNICTYDSIGQIWYNAGCKTGNLTVNRFEDPGCTDEEANFNYPAGCSLLPEGAGSMAMRCNNHTVIHHD